MSNDPALILSKEQELAFKALKKAFDRCEKLGLEIHGELQELHAVNTYGLNGRRVVMDDRNPAVTDGAQAFTAHVLNVGSDDGLGFE